MKTYPGKLLATVFLSLTLAASAHATITFFFQYGSLSLRQGQYVGLNSGYMTDDVTTYYPTVVDSKLTVISWVTETGYVEIQVSAFLPVGTYPGGYVDSTYEPIEIVVY